MGNNYLPQRESEFRDFGLNFAELVKAAPESYGLTAGDATQIDNAAKDYAAKYLLADSPSTRTAAAVVNKDNARVILTAILRGYAMVIKENNSVADDAKTNLGLDVSDKPRTTVAPPQTFPIVQLLAATPRQHELRFGDSGDSAKKGKPAGALGLQLFCQVSEPGVPAPGDPLSSRFQSLVTRTTYRMTFTAADVDKKAHYYARWYTLSGLTGPWSHVASMTVAG